MKRILAIVLCMLMCLTMLPTWALAEETDTTLMGEELTEEQSGEGIPTALIQEAEALSSEEEPHSDETTDAIEAVLPDGENAELPETENLLEKGEETAATETGTNPENEESEPAETEPAAEITAEAEPAAEITAEAESAGEKTAETEPEETQSADEAETSEAEAEEKTEEEAEAVLQAAEEPSAELMSASGTYGSLNWELSDQGVLSIWGNGEMTSTTYINYPWYSHRNAVEAVVIHGGVKSIGNQAFRGYTNLKTMRMLAPYIDSLKTIGDEAFLGCSKLTSAEINYGVTSIGAMAFSGCSSLLSMELPNGLTSIGNSAFFGCSKMAGITLTEDITSIGNSAFYDCSSLSEIAIPTKVTSLADALFSGCTQLSEVHLSDNITAIGNRAFYNCQALTAAPIPPKVTSIGDWAFASSGITKAEIPSGVKSIETGVFSGCFNLKNMTIPSNITQIGNYAFSTCGLTAIVIPATVSYVGEYAFAYNGNLASMKYSRSGGAIQTQAFANCRNLKEIVFVGEPPYIADDSFQFVTANVHYPDDGSWSDSKRQNYGGTLTWIAEKATLVFTDVSDPALYFYEPVYWAVEKGITTGRTPTTFDPYGQCTRGHIVTFLWRAFGEQEPTVNNPFEDVHEGDSFYKAVLWAYENGITTGQTATTFGPWNFCTRGQIVTFLWRAMGQAEPGISNPFTDVNPGDGFYRAVLWAVENGITTGRTPTTFDPWATCTRGQAVTFIYRAMNR